MRSAPLRGRHCTLSCDRVGMFSGRGDCLDRTTGMRAFFGAACTPDRADPSGLDDVLPRIVRTVGIKGPIRLHRGLHDPQQEEAPWFAADPSP